MVQMLCNVCPRECKKDRITSFGVCGMPQNFVVARASLHMWEEPCLSGKNGSGTVFFSGCSLKCVYCQNYDISNKNFGREITDEHLMEIFDSLIENGAHNINLVNPTHYALRLADILEKYRSPVPVIYNSSGYEKTETLKRLEGLIDIYLPDLKYIDNQRSYDYSGVKNYFEFASKAIPEMIRQTGSAVFDESGLMKKGTIIRHLVLPKNTNQTIKIIDWLKENVPMDTYISLMSQFTPIIRSDKFSELNRRITEREYEKVLLHLENSGFENCFIQMGQSAEESFIPAFDLSGI